MDTNRPTRKEAFRAALWLRGMTQAEWATQHGVTEPHVSQVASGDRESERLARKMDAFIAEVLSQDAPPAAAKFADLAEVA